MEYSIELLEGFTDKSGTVHKEVTFGRRLTVGDLIEMDSDPQARLATQYTLLIVRAAITKFGTLELRDPKTGKRKAVPMQHLLALDTVEITDLISGHDNFLVQSREGRVGSVIDTETVALAFGFERDGGAKYDLVKFGKRLTGADLVEADRQNLSGVARSAFEIARQIEKVTSSETGAETTITLEDFNNLDIEDFNLLRMGGLLWTNSFRRTRANLSGERNGKSNSDTDAGNTPDAGGDSELVN